LSIVGKKRKKNVRNFTYASSSSHEIKVHKAFKEPFLPFFNPYTANRELMAKSLPKELNRAEELIEQAKLYEALEIIEQFEHNWLNLYIIKICKEK